MRSSPRFSGPGRTAASRAASCLSMFRAGRCSEVVHESVRRDRARCSAFGCSGLPFDRCRHSAKRAGGRLARIVDRARVLKDRLDRADDTHANAIVSESHISERRGKLIYWAITLSTISALMVCFVIASLFASFMFRYSGRLFVSSLFIVAMFSSIISLVLFLREVFLAIETFEIALPAKKRTATA
jgi:hypothetical protein